MITATQLYNVEHYITHFRNAAWQSITDIQQPWLIAVVLWYKLPANWSFITYHHNDMLSCILWTVTDALWQKQKSHYSPALSAIEDSWTWFNQSMNEPFILFFSVQKKEYWGWWDKLKQCQTTALWASPAITFKAYLFLSEVCCT